MSTGMNRREFLKGSALAVAAATTGCATTTEKAENVQSTTTTSDYDSLLASAPALQNAAETSMGVAFAVNADASGWVEYSESPDLKDAVRVFSGEHGLMDVDNEIALVRLTGLKPATKYYYRIGADRIEFKGGYAMKNLGPEIDEKIHSFTTLGKTATGSFCVINDTHEQDSIVNVFNKVKELGPQAVIWNGDASNTSETREAAIKVFVTNHGRTPEFSSDIPFMFLNGNHDFRGRYNRTLGGVAMFREPTERKSEYEELGRNFVQRLGDIALIGLDTGEDKLDTNPKFAGIFKMTPYREKQAKWLAEAIETEAVKTAKFKVAFCHIPLFDPRPDANPGDLAPADKDPRYRKDYAAWQRTCSNLWSPYFEKAGVQLVVTGHQHRFRYDPPAPGRSWAQIVGGGPECGVNHHWSEEEGLTTTPNPEKFPTVIEGHVEGGKLVVTVHDVFNGKIVGRYDFLPIA